MPGQTPIYNFPYPCPGEMITPAAFSALANAIDSKLGEVNADMIFALNRPNVDKDDASTQVTNPGVVTTITNPDATYTIPVAGVWVVGVTIDPTTLPATVNYQRGQVLQNAVVRFGSTHDSEANITVTCRPFGIIVAAVGDVITATYLWTGTGTITVQSSLSAKLLCRIP